MYLISSSFLLIFPEPIPILHFLFQLQDQHLPLALTYFLVLCFSYFPLLCFLFSLATTLARLIISKRFPLNHGLWASCIAIIWEVIRNTDCPALTPNQGKMKVHFNKVFSVCVHSRLRNTPLYKIAPRPLKELGGKSRKKVFHTAGGRASDCSASVRKSWPDLGEALEETWPVRGVQRWPGFSISVQSLFRISVRE